MKKRVFISGASGVMGKSTLSQMCEHLDKLEIVALVRPSKKNKKQMKKYKDKIKIVWGDILDYEMVKKAIKDADYILHLAALVSPKADKDKDLTFKVNIEGSRNIIKAVKELKLENCKVVYIGSVAQYGDRLYPNHWGEVGDPNKPSVNDYYAASKIRAERLFINSDLKYWTSLRQTGILHEGLLKMRSPIIFHQPLNNVLEWVSDKDSARLLVNLCLKDLPDSFYNNIYNIGGGEGCRINNYKFMSKMLGLININDIEEFFDISLFAEKNFHGMYYLDSDILNDFLDFRRESFDDFLKRIENESKVYIFLIRLIPNFIKKFFFKKIIEQQKARKDKEVFFNRNKHLKDWSDFKEISDYSSKKKLNHGYNRKAESLEFKHIKFAANFRGGRCLSKENDYKNLDSKLKWQCTFKHEFELSARAVLKFGHWCPQCLAPPWQEEEIAKKNPFFAQVFFKDF